VSTYYIPPYNMWGLKENRKLKAGLEILSVESDQKILFTVNLSPPLELQRFYDHKFDSGFFGSSGTVFKWEKNQLLPPMKQVIISRVKNAGTETYSIKVECPDCN
jgi:hypothetical protein